MPTDPEPLSADERLGRAFRAMLNDLPPNWRVGFVRNDTGWRVVLLAPESGQPVMVTDAADIDGLFVRPEARHD